MARLVWRTSSKGNRYCRGTYDGKECVLTLFPDGDAWRMSIGMEGTVDYFGTYAAEEEAVDDALAMLGWIDEEDGPDEVTITDELLEHSRSVGGAWNRRQLEVLGIAWPPRKGWKRGLVGRVFPTETIERFITAGKSKQPADQPSFSRGDPSGPWEAYLADYRRRFPKSQKHPV